ncbi:glycosyltransferase family 4 protein [Leucobacter weissii]|uniref:Glycosyltransferase family 4 protein n=1 Tax=Leucobacter weissii TaxID=1983706 RepID=A0A939MSY6_9MICO|nr:glycosyltransferase [Leucobacter weissii]MBO1902419.1 glycosyltransferase family 4 protein [Leucobacter weissii]
MPTRIAFARWRSDVPSGGNRYDDELTAALRAEGFDVREHPVPGSWPAPGAADRARLRELLLADPGTPGEHWLIDNIVGSAAPEIIREATSDGRRVSMLMHFFAADERAIPAEERARLAAAEAEAVAAASAIVATSAWTAGEVARRYGRTDVAVALPGVEPAGLAPGARRGGGGSPRLLWLARVTRTKDPLALVDALAGLRDLGWSARLVGPDTIDPAFGREVRGRIAELGLADRVAVLGAREGDALASIWAETDLLVHTARSEAYGMVVTEALARGIPSVVPAGTGAVEAQQGAGGRFPPGDAAALAGALRDWLSDARLRERWRAAAAEQRRALPSWQRAARSVAAALAG